MPKEISKLLALILLLIIGNATALAHYSVREIVGNVQVKQGASVVNAGEGMTIRPTDIFIIPDYGKVKIIDTRTSQIYESTSSGQVSVTRLVFDASKLASDNSANIHNKLRMGRNGSGESVVYVEKGKVTRALSTFDPAAEQLQLDVKQLAGRIYAILSDTTWNTLDDQESALVILHRRNDRNGLSFMVENTMPFPVYFNVVKKTAGTDTLTLSELGQPIGSYALQPDQSITRAQSSGLDADGTHMLIVTNYYYDVDELLSELNALIVAGAPAGDNLSSFPLLIRKM